MFEKLKVTDSLFDDKDDGSDIEENEDGAEKDEFQFFVEAFESYEGSLMDGTAVEVEVEDEEDVQELEDETEDVV